MRHHCGMQTGETGRGCRSEPRHGNRVGLVLVAAVAALFTTGCLTSDAYVTVDGDGSGELRMEVFPPPEVSDTIAGSGVDALIRSALEGVEGATFESGKRFGQPHPGAQRAAGGGKPRRFVLSYQCLSHG